MSSTNGPLPAPEDLTILVVDDYEENRQMLAEILTSAGFKVEEARDGAEAIALAGRILPDLIVMDLSLPVIDGWEATRRLKRDDLTRHIPVLAMSGYAPECMAGHPKDAREAGCDGLLTKPCSPERLIEVVLETLDLSRRSAHKVRLGAVSPTRASGS